MSPRTRVIDRLATALVGLLLVAAGLLAVEWRYDLVLGLARRLDLTGVDDVLASQWWPWVLAMAGVSLALLGLRWMLAHVSTPNGTVVRTMNDDDTGSSRLDLSSLATATAARFAELAPVVSSGGSYRRVDGHHVVEVRAAVDDRTNARLLAEAVGAVDADLRTAFTDGAAHLRVLLGSPSRLPTAISRTPIASSSADASSVRVDRSGSEKNDNEENQMDVADKAKNAAEGKTDQAKSDVKGATDNVKDAFKK